VANLKKKIISYFVVTAVLLLMANIIIDVVKKKNSKQESKELSIAEIEASIWKILDDYGINANWITKKKYHESDEDSIKAQFFISIPSEVPTPLIIKSINNILAKDITGFVAEEKKIFGLTEIRIYTNEYLKLKATITPDPKLVRWKNEMAFVIMDAFDLTENQFTTFLSTHYPLACSIVPDPDLIARADSLSSYSKEYITILNNDISNSKMKLVPEFNKELLRSSIKNILSSFRKSKIVVVDEKSVLYNSPIFNFVRDEFQKRKIAVVPVSWFIKLESNDEQELKSKFKFFAQDTAISKQKIFYTTFDNFERLVPLIEKFAKKGSRLISVSKANLR
jgi:hypothetical protein